MVFKCSDVNEEAKVMSLFYFWNRAVPCSPEALNSRFYFFSLRSAGVTGMCHPPPPSLPLYAILTNFSKKKKIKEDHYTYSVTLSSILRWNYKTKMAQWLSWAHIALYSCRGPRFGSWHPLSITLVLGDPVSSSDRWGLLHTWHRHINSVTHIYSKTRNLIC